MAPAQAMVDAMAEQAIDARMAEEMTRTKGKAKRMTKKATLGWMNDPEMIAKYAAGWIGLAAARRAVKELQQCPCTEGPPTCDACLARLGQLQPRLVLNGAKPKAVEAWLTKHDTGFLDNIEVEDLATRLRALTESNDNVTMVVPWNDSGALVLEVGIGVGIDFAIRLWELGADEVKALAPEKDGVVPVRVWWD
jgi:hypothetical protein